MITKLASEILNGAFTKAGVYNVDFMTQLTMTNALNDVYRSAYQQIATSSSNYYAIDYKLTDDDVSEYKDNETAYPFYDLPEDVYLIKSVSKAGREISRCPPKQKIAGTYDIVNNKFVFYGNEAQNITITYIPVPKTITIPAESIKINLDPSTIVEYGKVEEKGFYYKTGVGNFYYNYDTEESTSVNLFKEMVYSYEDGTLDPKTFQIKDDDGEVILDLNEEYGVGDLNPIVKVVVDDPYMMISYKDGTILVLQNGVSTIWNIKAHTGHKTLGIIHGMKTNDSTLYGCLYEDTEGDLYLASFVPDTLLNYPTNSLFTMLEIDLACLVASMNNVTMNSYISETLRNETIKEFNDELRQNRANPVRISNQRIQRITRYL